MFSGSAGPYVGSHERDFNTRHVSSGAFRARLRSPRRVLRAIGTGTAAAAPWAGGAIGTRRHRAALSRVVWVGVRLQPARFQHQADWSTPPPHLAPSDEPQSSGA